MTDLGRTVQWYEAIWLAAMGLGFLANAWIAYQGLADRAAFRREAGRAAWRSDPRRIVANQQVRTALLSLVCQLGGLAVGVVAATSAPARPSGQPTGTGLMITLYLVVLAAILAVKPALNLRDNRRLYGLAAGLRARAVAEGEERRKRSVENLLGLTALFFALAAICYGAVLWQDLMVQADQVGNPPFSAARFAGLYCRALLNAAMTATLAGLVMGALAGAFYRLKAED